MCSTEAPSKITAGDSLPLVTSGSSALLLDTGCRHLLLGPLGLGFSSSSSRWGPRRCQEASGNLCCVPLAGLDLREELPHVVCFQPGQLGRWTSWVPLRTKERGSARGLGAPPPWGAGSLPPSLPPD